MRILKGLGRYFFRMMFISSVLSLSVNVLAEELSKENKDALSKTVKLLNSPEKRNAFIKENEQAQKANEMIKQLFGENGMNDAYAAAAEIFKSLVHQNNGDSKEMMKIMEKAQENPAEFLKGLSAEHQQRIKGLAEKVESERNPSSPK